MTREYENWKNRSTNKNEQLLKIQHYIKVRLLHDRQSVHHPAHLAGVTSQKDKSGLEINLIQANLAI